MSRAVHLYLKVLLEEKWLILPSVSLPVKKEPKETEARRASAAEEQNRC